MISLLDIIRADNKRYRELLELFEQLADVTVKGPANEGRERKADAAGPSKEPGDGGPAKA